MKVVFYGSLRLNEYNYNAFKNRFGEDNFKYLGTTTIEGYTLHSLGSYPVIIPTQEQNKTVVVDIMELNDSAYEAVKRMELGAGYREINVILNYRNEIRDRNESIASPIYIMDVLPSYAQEEVEHGDWSLFCRERERVREGN